MTHHHLGEPEEAGRVYEKLKTFEPRYAATLKRDIERTPRHAATVSPTRSASDHREATAATQ